MLCPADKRFRDGRTDRKIHIGHPHGDGVKPILWKIRRKARYLSQAVQGNGIVAFSVDDRSKIVFHVSYYYYNSGPTGPLSEVR